MADKLGIVQYWVFKRPKTVRGRIIYGAELGATKDDFGQVFSGETLLINNGGMIDQPDPTLSKQQRNGMKLDPVTNKDVFDITVVPDNQYEPITGQPWILHSVHFGVDEALKAAKPLIISNGEDNIKICKILSHETIVKMS